MSLELAQFIGWTGCDSVGPLFARTVTGPGIGALWGLSRGEMF